MLKSIINDNLTITSFLICMLVAIILGIVSAITHMITTRSNKNFVTTLAIVPILVSLVILLVNGNLGTSVAVLGAFSLIRFRSIPGNSREIISIFFSMAIGLAVGTGYIAFAAIFTVIVSLFTIILNKFNFGESENEMMLTILIPEDLDYTNVFDDIFKKYLKSYELVKTKTTNMGSLFTLTYKVEVKKDINEKEFIDKLRVKNGNLKIVISHPIIEEDL